MAWNQLDWEGDLRVLARRLLDIGLTEDSWAWRGESDLFAGVRSSFDRSVDCLTGPGSRIDVDALERRYYTKWWWHVLELVNIRDLHGPSTETQLPNLTWLNFAQHHGCKTRLVDWTHSPWIGLYFAMAPKNAGAVRRLWGFKTQALSRSLAVRWAELRAQEPVDLTPIIFGRRADCADLVCTQFNMRPPNRMSAQKGLFTVAACLNAKHDELLDALIEDTQEKVEIRIPADFRVGLLGMLRAMNVDHESLDYPMIDQIAGSLTPSDVAREA